MKRIMVMGVSAGVGKSTFAKRLGKELGIKAYHLDTMFWKPGWIQASLEEFSGAQNEVVKKEQWIIDGNYSSTVNLRAAYADAIIYLELPLGVCLFRVVKRWLINFGKTREDMTVGCEEKLDWAFIKFICTTYYPRKHSAEERLEKLQKLGPRKTIIILKSKREMETFLKQLQFERKQATYL
ncbi:P-loop NTPase family protein [Bacillus solitudinis]|uniref:topology modulation protein n=1 Tax=Bacillus solitudinis TaxID=2014074 RepID=UPI000C230928|nr:topology modulation protein [Bacillus solitudinis]